MEVDDGQRDEQKESEDQPEQLRRVLGARQPTELERQKHSQMNHSVFAPWCEVCVKSKRNRSTALETDEQGIGEARTIRIQNLLRFLLHVRGRSFDADACVENSADQGWLPQLWNRKD